ncbi:MAG: fimbrillin family protein, partial [Parabacteroides sp.]|nr:fimbrillin family protein [Parabacteroides sp.]
SIPIDVTENQDVMWATPYSGAYNASPTATLPMNHALSVIRFSLSKGDYSGDGNITSIKIKGAGMAKTGFLNAKDGAVTPTDGGAEIDLGATTTLTGVAQTVEQLVIPTNASGNISVTIQMDGKTFEATSSAPITPEQSKAYKFGLAFSDSKLTMSTVTIGSLDEVDEGNMTPIVQNNPWKDVLGTDGVYAIKDDGSPVAYADASDDSYAGVAIVMYGRALQISNRDLSSQVWGSQSVNISGITDMTKTGGGVTGIYGYLLQPSGSYNGTPHIETYDLWLNTPNTALADTAGWSNTEALITAHSGLTPSSSYMGAATVDFRNGANNQGYSDWFVPSAAQLAYIYMNHDKINELLPKCGGETLLTSFYWSSSEYSTDSAWLVHFVWGRVDTSVKGGNFVRFCRYITE